MSIICKMNGALLTAPCSASACHFFGDCITDWKKTLAKPQTNGDRLRDMSDDELVEHLFRLYRLTIEDPEFSDISMLWCDGRAGCVSEIGEIECDEERHKVCVLRWLKSEAV